MPVTRLCLILCAIAVVSASCTGDGSSTVAPSTSSSSSTEVISTDPVPVVDETPTAPTGLLVVSTGDGTIELVWDAARSDAVSGYEVTRVGAGATERTMTTEPTLVDTELDNGTIYTYSVSAISTSGQSQRSESVSAQVGVDSNPPSTPGRPVSSPSADSTVSLSWRPSTDVSGVANYIVTRTIRAETVELVVEEPSLADDIPAGTVASYAVAAVDGNGNESAPGRAVTVLAGTTADQVVIVVSAIADPSSKTHTARLQQSLLDSGYFVSWFEDDVFDANVTDPGDVVLLLGDVQGDGFDWNVFLTDSTIIGLKSMFVVGGGITENAPKLDRLSQLDYTPPGEPEREVVMTASGRPKPTVYIPPGEQLPDFEIWARPVWSTDIAVAGLIPAGGELANEKPSPGCRAFFPGNNDSLAEQADSGWDLLLEFVGDIAEACG